MVENYADLPIVVLGGGPAGMASALGLIKAGHKVVVYERYSRSQPAGSVLNLYPPPIKALEALGVDIVGLGSENELTFRNATGLVRANVYLPTKDASVSDGFIGMLRPDLYSRMQAAIPEAVMQFNHQVEHIEDNGDHVALTFSNGKVVRTPLLIGADGIDSIVRPHLWGQQPKRNHDLLVVSGYTLEPCPSAVPHLCPLHHSPTKQGTWCSIVSNGRRGYQWWFVEAWPDSKAIPSDLKAHALKNSTEFPPTLKEIIEATKPGNVSRWNIRDRVPIPQWSKGRMTLAGDAAHPVSPYAGYGAGMSICDGYFLGQVFYNVNLADNAAVQQALSKYDKTRVSHANEQVNIAHFLGRLFHYTPWPLTILRDFVMDYTPFLQKVVGDRNPQEIMNQLKVMGEGITKPAQQV